MSYPLGIDIFIALLKGHIFKVVTVIKFWLWEIQNFSVCIVISVYHINDLVQLPDGSLFLLQKPDIV